MKIFPKNLPLNQEHIEHFQEETNKALKKFVKKLDKKDRIKYKAIFKCSKILKEAEVHYHLFPFLKTKSNLEIKGAEDMTLFTSMPDHTSFDADGKRTEETLNMMKKMQSALLSSLIEKDIFSLTDIRDPKFEEEICNYLFTVLHIHEIFKNSPVIKEK